MPVEHPEFADYLSRHYAHIGDQARYRAGKKQQLLLTYRDRLPSDRAAAMLEIGPGYGQLLELLRRDLGYTNATAVDLSQEVVDFCNGVLPGSTHYGADTIAYLQQRPGQFERVFALHVLEHVPRDQVLDLVRAIRAALKPGGVFLLEIPNMANLFTSSYLRYADRTHEAGYSELSVRNLLESAGLAPVECFEERIPMNSAKGLLANAFRAGAALTQRLIYKGYELPVPRVLTPALCAAATRPDEPA